MKAISICLQREFCAIASHAVEIADQAALRVG